MVPSLLGRRRAVRRKPLNNNLDIMCHVDSERNYGTWGAGWLQDSILSLPSILNTFCQELWTSGAGWLHDSILSLPSFLSTFCKELRSSGGLYLIFTFFLSTFCKELRTSGVGWLHDSILSPPSFLSTFCKELRTSSVSVGWLYFLSHLYLVFWALSARNYRPQV